jgi:spermidine/putrescine-binding protein
MKPLSKKVRIIAASMAAVVVLGVVATIVGVTYVPRKNTLKILNWEDYMPKSVIKDFEKKVRRETGEKFRVAYHTMESNESMYSQIKVNKADYDLICVSEYMVERMYAEGLLLELKSRIFPCRRFHKIAKSDY